MCLNFLRAQDGPLFIRLPFSKDLAGYCVCRMAVCGASSWMVVKLVTLMRAHTPNPRALARPRARQPMLLPCPPPTPALAGPIGDSGHMTHPGNKALRLRLFTIIEWH